MTRSLLLAGLLALAPAATAQASLFTPVDRARTAAPEQLTVLESEIGVVGTALVAADLDALDAPTLALHLLGADVAYERADVVVRDADDWTWVGRRGGEVAVLVVREGLVTGLAWADGEVFEIRPMGGALHAVARIDQSRRQAHGPDAEAFHAEADARRAAERPSPGPAAPAAAARSGPTTVIDVIAPYTAEHAAAYLDPIGAIQLAIDISNVAFTNTGIAAQLRLVYAYLSPTAATTSINDDLSALQNTTDGRFDDVHQLRTDYGADLVALFGNGAGVYGGTCGLGYVDASAEWAFTVTAYDCAGSDVTLAHEVGHNAGSSHDPYVNTGTLAYAYGQGTVNTAGRWKTVMSYNNECQDAGFNCTTIPYWSSPAITYDDTTAPEADGPTGDAATRDNGRLWSERMATLAAFRAAPTGASVASVTPAAVSVSLAPGATTTERVTIANAAAAGSYPLSWRGTTDNVAQDGTPLGTPCAAGQPLVQSAIAFFDLVGDGTPDRGQSFAAPCFGRLREVAVQHQVSTGRVNNTWGGTLRVYDGAGTAGTTLATAPVTQTNAASTGLYFAAFPLPAPVDVASGATYTWFLEMTAGEAEVLYSNANPYAGGTGYSGATPAAAAPVASDDMAYRAVFDAPDLWYTAASPEGSVGPGGSFGLDLAFDATGLTGGTYAADLVLTTNDPAAPTVTVPLTLTVAPVAADGGPDAERAWLAVPAPNPTRGAATLAYGLAEAGDARLAVIDLLGREVAVLADGAHAAGAARVSLPVDLPAGVYVVRLEADGGVWTRRAVVVR